ncbi:MAG TPA: 1,4-dihydroxy-2-naphthoate octaprenyltransferase [Vicinamibacterales bacterium]|jgi:1,4-dihydroxy-2-naphthoate octaprenyltransferase
MVAIETGAVRPWLLAARPKTLTASLSPVMVGTGLAVGLLPGTVSLWLSALALASALCIQIATNLVNDAADFERGADTAERLGPTRVTQSGLLHGGRVMLGAALFFLMAILLGVPLVVAGGPPVVIIGLLSIVAGYAYTTGPFPLAYLGLGEVFVLLFFGVAAVKGMAYVLTGQSLSPWAELGALQVGFHSSALLAVNNCRDIVGDRKAGKRTLAARWGQGFARVEIAGLVALPYLIGACWLRIDRPWAAMLPVLTLPLAVRLVVGVWREPPSRRFNIFLAQTSLLQLTFSALVALGLVL